MTFYERALAATARVTRVSRRQIVGRRRNMPYVEARRLLILTLWHRYTDQMIADYMKRSRVTIFLTRRGAIEYMLMSRTFANKYERILKILGIDEEQV